jgi:hypothetical protein
MRLEPAAIFPSEYLQKVENLYAKIITPGALGIGSQSIPEFGWGHFKSSNPLIPGKISDKSTSFIGASDASDETMLKLWRGRPIDVSMVVSNKVSPLKSSNYSVRRRIAKENNDEFVQIFGTLWKESVFSQARHRIAVLRFNLVNHYWPNLRSVYGGLHNHYFGLKGPVDDKFKVLSRSKFTIVIENQNTYISEKIFDAIASSCVPIYLGPKLEQAGIPKGVAIQVKDDKFDVRTIVRNASDQDVLEVLKNGIKFLQSDSYTSHWSEKGANEKIVRALLEVFK